MSLLTPIRKAISKLFEDGEVASIASTLAGKGLSLIGYDNSTSGLDAVNGQAAIDELAADVAALGGGEGLDLDEIAYDNTTSGLAAEDGQAAVDELAAEKANLAGGAAFTGRVTTTDGVASGIAAVTGGRLNNFTATADTLLASEGTGGVHRDFATTVPLPADTLTQGKVIALTAVVIVDNADNADELEGKLKIGATTLLTSTAFDAVAVGDLVIFEYLLWALEAPGAAAQCAGIGTVTTVVDGVATTSAPVAFDTTLATDAELIVAVSASWSATGALTAARLLGLLAGAE